MSVYDLKPRFQALLRPFCRALAGKGVTANQVTLAAAALSLAHGAALAFLPNRTLWLLLIPVTLFVRMALNAIDGMLAREHGQKTRLGALLNEIGDVVSDSALYLPFALVAGLSPMAAVLIVIFYVLSEMTGVLAQTIGSSRRYDGPMGKSDRAAAFSLLAVLLALDWISAGWAQAYQWVVLGLLVVTIANRAHRALGHQP